MGPLTELQRVLPPPRRPRNAAGDWAIVEGALGLRLPADYKAYIGVYGGGSVNNCLEVPSPLGLPADPRGWWEGWADLYRDLAAYEPVPYPAFPDPGGLLPFGTLGDASVLNWLTTGDPDRWPFVFYHRTEGFIPVAGQTAVGFLLEAVTGRSPVLIRVGADGPFRDGCDFEPLTPDPRSVRLVHPHSIDMERLASRLAERWPAGAVRVRRLPTGVLLLVERIDGRVSLSREGDERTWAGVRYDQESRLEAELILGELRDAGFSEVGPA